MSRLYLLTIHLDCKNKIEGIMSREKFVLAFKIIGEVGANHHKQKFFLFKNTRTDAISTLC